MNWIDLVALVIVALAVLDGATSGALWAILETCLLLGSAVLAKSIRPHAQEYVLKVANVGADELPWISHLVVFALTLCVLFGVLLLLHPAIKKRRFKHDKWIGGAVGVLNGLLASVLIASMIMASTAQPYDAELRGSHTVRAARVAWDVGAGPAFLPDHVPARSHQLWGE